MKTSAKIVIVAVLALAVVAAVALKKGKSSSGSNNPAPPMAASATQEGVVAKLPKLLDLGATKCIPCKMMAPILEEMKKDYEGRLEVEFIDVWLNPDAESHSASR